jgi:hypothetical protein
MNRKGSERKRSFPDLGIVTYFFYGMRKETRRNPKTYVICVLDVIRTQTLPNTSLQCGRAIAQAVSCRFPTATARDRVRIRSCGISGGESGTGVGFLRVLPLPLPILIPPTAPQSPFSIIRGWYNRPVSGRRTNSSWRQAP